MEDTVKKNNVKLKLVDVEQERFFKITDSDSIRPFFMSVVSDSDHWMFISSNGGLSAGRRNAEYALFPYYTDDKITESAEITGSKSIFLVHEDDKFSVWEPFSDRFEGRYKITRNLYKNIYGNKILFEEINHDLQLTFRYQWNSSNSFGFVKKSSLISHAEKEVRISLLDGIQNIMPFGVSSDLQNQSSNLVDAYKRCELEKNVGLGIYSLSAIIVDKAEPSEALKANIVWSKGLDNPKYLLSSRQLKAFRRHDGIEEEYDVKGEKGAYFVQSELTLEPGNTKKWMIVADVNRNHASISEISESIESDPSLEQAVIENIDLGTKRLIELNASADGLQLSSDRLRDSRHFSNTLFNIMRGGIFDDNYQVGKKDFSDYLAKANKNVFKAMQSELNTLPEEFNISDLRKLADEENDLNFKRLCLEYMPLKFSRRHGDPSRPWNKFSINTRSEIDGSKILDYEGNWRDIFQNWEALAHSFPEFIESMIHKFLNATTFDGYNPYRVTKGGFDWETIEPDDPWSYIGYWGDHQIIYLLKFLEFLEKHEPGKLGEYFDSDLFVYANVPYKIKSYEDILSNPKDTIEFDEALDEEVRTRRSQIGADGALLMDENGDITHVNLIEKLLATLLAKLSNFIPEGGIWMNTQRPEWNDANNALVGNGVSMVTLYYLRRFLHFFRDLVTDIELERVSLSNELIVFFKAILSTFEDNQKMLSGKIDDSDRKIIMDSLGEAGSEYRDRIYKQTFWGNKRTVSVNSIQRFLELSTKFVDHTIKANQRPDKLYHAYNLMTIENDSEVSISYLSEMLEGQVAVLSSGYLTSSQSLEVLDGLKNSALFRDDQYSYILYPNKDLARFVVKNNIDPEDIAQSALLTKLVEEDHIQIVERDIKGVYHFNGNFKNASDLQRAINELDTAKYAALVKKENRQVLQIFEKVFNHKAFTGRSGTFFGYEGLGSIYWHMVSKLQLAVQECCFKAVNDGESERLIGKLLEHYYEINAGIGVHKSPSLYGAFPTDPYSHTPAGKGVQQPGMTGQVKEDILCRFGELGVCVEDGKLYFDPCLLRRDEFLKEPKQFKYVDVQLASKELDLAADTLTFTYCQVPIVYQLDKENKIVVIFKDNTSKSFDSLSLDAATSVQLFERTGEVVQLIVHLKESKLR